MAGNGAPPGGRTILIDSPDDPSVVTINGVVVTGTKGTATLSGRTTGNPSRTAIYIS